jgi:CubicO group peptidase (beta-lactamase class C family)
MGSNLLPKGQWLPNEKGVVQDGVGYGAGVSVVVDPAPLAMSQGAGTMSWGGAASTLFWVDPQNDLLVVWMIQHFGAQNSVALRKTLSDLVYQSLAKPEL